MVGDVWIEWLGVDFRISGGVGEHQCEVSAGGSADDTDLGGVDFQFLRVHAEPADCIFTILEIGGPAVFGAFPVFDTDTEVASSGERITGDDFAFGSFVAADPTAAVDDDDCGSERAWSGRAWMIDVEFLLAAGSEVVEVFGDRG